jgi:hypothetical protein
MNNIEVSPNLIIGYFILLDFKVYIGDLTSMYLLIKE